MPDPVVLIHGAWQGSRTFDALLPALDAVGLVGVAIARAAVAAAVDHAAVFSPLLVA